MSEHHYSMLNNTMEGDGSYNRHSSFQADGRSVAIPKLSEAAQYLTINQNNNAIIIADYGSSQGKNSIEPIAAAVKILKDRTDNNKNISIYHTDLPNNDFNTLFNLFDSRKTDYFGDEKVYYYAIGKTFYEQLFQNDFVDLGWSSYAAMWLSKIPAVTSDHFFPCLSTGEAKLAFSNQAAEDWQRFLTLRARELRLGGRLIIVLGGIDDNGATGLNDLMNDVASILSSMMNENIITKEERDRMIIGSYPRRRDEILAPFDKDEMYEGLTPLHYEMSILPDPSWKLYKERGDVRALSNEHASFFRSAFLPSLIAGLDSTRGVNEKIKFGDTLQNELATRLSTKPRPLERYVQTLVLTKPLL